MKINSKLFSAEQLTLLKSIGIIFKDGKDYSDDEVFDMEDRIEDALLEFGFTLNGEPTEVCDEWEDLFDKFREVTPE